MFKFHTYFAKNLAFEINYTKCAKYNKKQSSYEISYKNYAKYIG